MGAVHTDKADLDQLAVTLYISKPEGDSNPKAAVLYLTDVFGIQLAENKLCVPRPVPSHAKLVHHTLGTNRN